MTEPPPGGWGPCPPGELRALAAWLRFRRRLWAAAGAGVVVLAAAGLVGAGWATWSALRADPEYPSTAPRRVPPDAGLKRGPVRHGEPPAVKN